MEYNSLEQIKSDFKLNQGNLDQIRDALNTIRVTLHPDKNNGEFACTADEARYHKTNDAINYIERLQNNHSLMIVERVTELIKVVTEMIPTRDEHFNPQMVERKTETTLKQYRSRHNFPKITLAALSAMLTALAIFPKIIHDNPTLTKLLNPQSPLFIGCWLTMLGLTGCVWLLAYIMEEKAKKTLSNLKLETTQNRLFNDFIEDNAQFTKDDLTGYIYGSYKDKKTISRFLGHQVVTEELTQEIATLIINRGCKKGVIQNLEIPSLDDLYEVNGDSF
jgi:hypothetical protein